MSVFYDPQMLALLKQIHWVLSPKNHLSLPGIHPTSQLGRSTEFAGYREYRVGDEVQGIDWKTYARTDRYYIRLKDAHTPVKASVILDDSASMQFQSHLAPISKQQASFLLAYAFGKLFERQGDFWQSHTLEQSQLPLRLGQGKQHFSNYVQWLEPLLKPSPSSESSSPGWPPQSCDVALWISDGLVETETQERWVSQIHKHARRAYFLQVLDPMELAPPEEEAVLYDLEHPSQWCSVSAQQWKYYVSRIKEHQSRLQKLLKSVNIQHHLYVTNTPIAAFLQKVCR